MSGHWRISASLSVALLTLATGCSDRDAFNKGLAESDRCRGACVIVFDTVAALGAEPAEVSPKDDPTAIQTASGQFILAPTDHPGVLAVYDSSGVLQRTFGTLGEAPGEYDLAQVQFHRGRSDTISIIDVFALRRTVIDNAGNVIRVHRIPDRFPGYFEIGGVGYFLARKRGEDGNAYVVHRLNDAGDIVASGVEPAGPGGIADSYLGRAPNDSGVWVAGRTKYEANFYDRDLTRVASVEPAAGWFKPHQAEYANPAQERPEPRILYLHQDTAGILWFIISVADREWEAVEEQGEVLATTARTAKFNDWILEAVDPQSGERLGSARFDWPIIFGNGDGLVYGMGEGSNGQGVLTAMRVKLRGRTEPPRGK